MLIKQISNKKIKVADKEYERQSLVINSKGEIFDWSKKDEVLSCEDLSFALNKDLDVLTVAKNEQIKKIEEEAQKKLKEKDILLIFDNLTEAINSFNVLVKQSKKAAIVVDLNQRP